ncbi:MAG: Hpt domain-containing protein [Pseudomonadota bacterium]
MATLIDQEFFARLNALNEKFATGVPATLERLQQLHASFNAGAADPALVREIHQTLHTIAGSAATFGFRVMGQRARELEQRLRVLMAFEQVAEADWANWLASLDAYLAWGRLDPRSDA